ncbi:MAG: FtsX-like permease family protein [bacterium]|nr:FtsX-like permease family protein [bacterium]
MKKDDKYRDPPRIAERVLKKVYKNRKPDTRIGDFGEIFNEISQERGIVAAWFWYWYQVILIFFQRIKNFTYGSVIMLKSYLKIAFRNIKRRKGYTFINVSGLSIGLAFCIMIFLYVKDEYSFDRFHDNSENIYRVMCLRFNPDGSVRNTFSQQPIPLGPALISEIPDIIQFVRFRELKHYVRKDEVVNEENILYSDPSIFNVFSFDLQEGDTNSVLSDLNSVVLSENAAHKYFGDENPVGRSILIKLEDSYEEFIVTGIAENTPAYSTIRFDFLLPFRKLTNSINLYRESTEDWYFLSIQTYVETVPGISNTDLQKKLQDMYYRHDKAYVDRIIAREKFSKNAVPLTYDLQKLTDIHLIAFSSPKYSYILSGIALVILLIACINFTTLSIGLSSSRSKEIGMRKVIGARRKQLAVQYWGETIIISFLALFFGVILTKVALPVFNNMVGKELDLTLNIVSNIMPVMLFLVLITSLLAGSYPALVLSGFKPIAALQKKLKLAGSNMFTKALVVAQFALSLFLINSTLIMSRQFDYTRDRSPGYDKEQVISIPLKEIDWERSSAWFMNLPSQNTVIKDITASDNSLGGDDFSGTRFNYRGSVHFINIFSVEPNYPDFFELELVKGSFFELDPEANVKNAVIINEALAKEFGMTDPIGKNIPGYSKDPARAVVVIGVIKDYSFQSFYNEIKPLMLAVNIPWKYDNLLVRVYPDKIPEAISLLDETWNEIIPDIPFSYSFLDETMEAQYKNDHRWNQIVGYGSAIAIFIASIGLFGLITLTSGIRTKEIGVRKVLGASPVAIVRLLLKDYLYLLTLGIFIATPFTFVVMEKWLENFAFRISFGAGLFVLGGILTLLAVILVMSIQAFKAAVSDPVDSLRYE